MNYHFPIKPRPHQIKALKFLLRNRGGGLQVPMRWGKTATAVHFANCMHLLENVQRVLVVCPISVLGVWPEEIEKNTPPGIKLDWRIVNFESVYSRERTRGRGWRPVPNQELMEWRPDLLIVDESHNIGNPQTVTSKHVFRLSRIARFRLIMTGTMFHRKPFFVFGQAKVYDPAIFGEAWTPFKRHIAVFGGYGGYEVIRYQNLRWMMNKLKPWVFMQEYVPPSTEPVVNVLRFSLSGRNADVYEEMERESIIEVNGRHVISPIVLTKHLRLQQIAGGWVKVDGKYVKVGNDLARIASDRLREYAEQSIDKVVIGCQFIPELRDAALAAKAHGYRVFLMHGGVPKSERHGRVKSFAEYDGKAVFIAQISTMREGVDLSCADVMMFYSLSPSYVTHDQFSRRIEKYNETRTLMYDYLVPVGTRTEVTFEALRMKKDVAQFMQENPDRVEEITASTKGDKSWGPTPSHRRKSRS